MTEGPKPEKRETLLGFPIVYVEGAHPFGDEGGPLVPGESPLADPEWEVVPEQYPDYSFSLRNRKEHFEVNIRRDGCINLWMFSNGHDDVTHEDTDYVHICYLDAMIAALQEAKKRALAHFGQQRLGG